MLEGARFDGTVNGTNIKPGRLWLFTGSVLLLYSSSETRCAETSSCTVPRTTPFTGIGSVHIYIAIMIEEILAQTSPKTLALGVVGALGVLWLVRRISTERKIRALGGHTRIIKTWLPYGS